MNIETYLRDELRIPNSFSEVVLTEYNKFIDYPEPNVAGDDNIVFLIWDVAFIHIDVEIYPDRHCEFFYMDKDTDETFDEEYPVERKLSAGIIQRMNLLTKI